MSKKKQEGEAADEPKKAEGKPAEAAEQKPEKAEKAEKAPRGKKKDKAEVATGAAEKALEIGRASCRERV